MIKVKRLEMVEAPDLGNEDGVMPKKQSPRKPTARRYSAEEKAAAVRMVRTLRAELSSEHGTIQRVANQLGYGVESVRSWVRQADIDDGRTPGFPSPWSKSNSPSLQQIQGRSGPFAPKASATALGPSRSWPQTWSAKLLPEVH